MPRLEDYFEVVLIGGRAEIRPKGPEQVLLVGEIIYAGYHNIGLLASGGNIVLPFLADRQYEIVAVKERHGVADTDVGAVTLMVKKYDSGQAPGAGVDVLASGINLKAAANVPQDGVLHSSIGNRRLKSGGGLVMIATGTTNCADVSLVVYLRVLDL